jgi:hypothetical protein
MMGWADGPYTHVDAQIANEPRRNPALQDMSFIPHMSNGSRIGQASLTSPSLLNSWRCTKKSANIRKDDPAEQVGGAGTELVFQFNKFPAREKS